MALCLFLYSTWYPHASYVINKYSHAIVLYTCMLSLTWYLCIYLTCFDCIYFVEVNIHMIAIYKYSLTCVCVCACVCVYIYMYVCMYVYCLQKKKNQNAKYSIYS